MNERVQAVTLSGPEPTSNDAVATALRAMMDREGPTLLFEPDALRLRLETALPGAADRIAQVLAALDAQVPQALLGVHADEELHAASLDLERRLVATGGLDSDAAKWAVATWAKALRVDASAVPAGPAKTSPPAPPGARMPVTGVGGRSAIEAAFEHDGLAPPIAPFVPGPSETFEAAPVEPRPAARARSFTRPLHLAYGIVGVVAAGVIGFYANRYLTGSDADSPGLDVLRSLPAPAASGPSVPVPESPTASAPARSSIEDTGAATPPATASSPIEGPSSGTPRSAAAPPAVAPVANAALQAARPSTIEDIAGLSDVPVGRPFDLIIAYRVGDREPATIERTVLERRGAHVVSTTPVSTLARGADGALVYPFDAMARPARTTMEFVLIDADGVRSEPRRVVLDVVAPATARVAASACTRATCGSVVSTRPLGPPVDTGIGGRVATAVAKVFGRETPPAAPDAYEVTIRMDDRSVHTMTRLTPWKPGTRVRLVANRFVALNERAPTGRAARREGRLLPESAPFAEP